MGLGQPTWIDMAIWVCLNNRIPGVTTRKYDGWPMLIGWSVDHFPYSNGHMEYPSASISFIFRLTRTLHTFHGAKTRPGKALEHHALHSMVQGSSVDIHKQTQTTNDVRARASVNLLVKSPDVFTLFYTFTWL
jgi:hypothetical protein